MLRLSIVTIDITYIIKNLAKTSEQLLLAINYLITLELYYNVTQYWYVSVSCEDRFSEKLNSTFLQYSCFEISPLSFNPLTHNIKEQILLFCPHAFVIKVLGRSY